MKKILFLVSDERAIQEIKRTIPLLSTNQCVLVEDLSEAINLLASGDFFVVFSQFSNRLNGLQFLQFVKSNFPSVFRVLMPEQSTKDKISSAINDVHRILRIPFSSDDLIRTINHYKKLIEYELTPEVINIVHGLGEVPVLPEMYIRLQREMEKSEISISRISDIIATEPFVTGKILQIVYSSFFNISAPILGIVSAINFLGLDIVKSLVLYVKIFTIKNVKSHTQNHLKKLRSHSIKVAKLSKAIMNTEVMDRKLIDDAYTVGLLHDIGKILLIQFNDKHLVSQDFDESTDFNIRTNEKEYFGVDHIVAGSYLLNTWNFPKIIVDSIANHHNFEILEDTKLDLPQVLLISNALTNDNKDYIAKIEEIYGVEKVNSWRELIPNTDTISDTSN